MHILLKIHCWMFAFLSTVNALEAPGHVTDIKWSDGYPVANITIGGQQLSMLLDTGSSDLWALGSNASATLASNQPIYDPSKSPTGAHRVPNTTFHYGYASNQTVSGPVWTDEVCIAGECLQNIAVGVVDSSSGSDLPFVSGIVGLGFGANSSGTPFGAGTFVQLAGDLSERTLTFVFQPGAGGYVAIGATDSGSYQGSLAAIGINSRNKTGQWLTSGVTFVSNGIALGVAPSMLIDTGTDYTGMPKESIASYISQIPGATYNGTDQLWRFPCSETLPDLQYIFANQTTATVHGIYLNQGPEDDTGSTCVLNMQEATDGCPVGQAFFFSNVAVFDYDQPDFSFAPHSSCA